MRVFIWVSVRALYYVISKNYINNLGVKIYLFIKKESMDERSMMLYLLFIFDIYIRKKQKKITRADEEAGKK